MLMVMLPFLFLIYLNGTAHANAGGMDAVITQLKGGPGGLRKVSPDKLPARFLADMGMKPAAARPATAAPVARAAPAVVATAAPTPTAARQPSTTRRTTTTTRTTTTDTYTTHRKVTFYEDDVDEEFEFTGIIWPKGIYGVYADIKDFDMSDSEKVTTRNARPKVLDTRDDGKFAAKFTAPRSREPDSVFLHIFGSKKDPHLYLDVSEVQWGNVYIFDLNKTEVIAVRPRRVADELRKLEERDRPPVKREQPKPQPQPQPQPQPVTFQKILSGLVWPTTEKYTLLVASRDFDLDGRGSPIKHRATNPDPTRAETNYKGTFDVKMALTERPETFYVWVSSAKGGQKRFVIPAYEVDSSKFALDMRTGKVEPFQRLENVLRKLKSVGMINNEQIPSGPPKRAVAAAEPARAAVAPSAGSDMLNSIKAMVNNLGAVLEKKIEQQHAKLKQDIETELEQRVGQKLVAVGKRLGLVDDTLKDMYKKLPREIEDVIAAEFDVLYKKKLIGKLDGKA
ncbi:hypothetical protein niasHT_034169 [Heterodera trifolii]